MAVIDANYAVMAAGGQGLTNAWNRIESLLTELETLVMGTQDMRSDAVEAYRVLKSHWSSTAVERQTALKELAAYVEESRHSYQQMDSMLARQFGG